MIREKPLVGIGPGRVDRLYTQYLAPGDPVPAYHGHLHNNLVQLGAEFGAPATLAGLIFIGILFRDLWRRYQSATDRDEEFLCRTSLLGLTGFIAAGLFEYTYGHSLGLILVAFTVLSPLVPAASSGASTKGSPSSREKITVGTALGG
jgi:O-antigen ligase